MDDTTLLVPAYIEAKLKSFGWYSKISPFLAYDPKAFVHMASEIAADPLRRISTVGMKIYMHTMEMEVKRFPRTWWDAFKERWFPAWAKRRWPVEWDEFGVDAILALGRLHEHIGSSVKIAVMRTHNDTILDWPNSTYSQETTEV